MNNRIIIFILGILLCLALLYIGTTKYWEVQKLKTDNAFMNGTIYGYQQAIYSIMSEASQCKQVPITTPQLNLTLVALECLKE